MLINKLLIPQNECAVKMTKLDVSHMKAGSILFLWWVLNHIYTLIKCKLSSAYLTLNYTWLKTIVNALNWNIIAAACTGTDTASQQEFTSCLKDTLRGLAKNTDSLQVGKMKLSLLL